MHRRHLAQANVARQRAPLTSPIMGEVALALDPVCTGLPSRARGSRYLRRRDRWFEPVAQPSTVLWWVEEGERPTVEAALRRLRYLRAHGPSPEAFTLLRR